MDARHPVHCMFCTSVFLIFPTSSETSLAVSSIEVTQFVVVDITVLRKNACNPTQNIVVGLGKKGCTTELKLTPCGKL